jgi:hypothetical protein
VKLAVCERLNAIAALNLDGDLLSETADRSGEDGPDTVMSHLKLAGRSRVIPLGAATV